MTAGGQFPPMPRVRHYVLSEDGRTPMPCADLHTWAATFGRQHIAGLGHKQTVVLDAVQVSTVFLGLDHAYLGGEPILWETMLFWADGESLDEWTRNQFRYRTWEHAHQHHDELVQELTAKITEARAIAAHTISQLKAPQK